MNKLLKRKTLTISLALLLLISAAGCGQKTVTESPAAIVSASPASADSPIPGLVYDHAMEIKYAKNFTIDCFKDGYYLITTNYDGAGQKVLVVPENGKVPDNIDKDTIIAQQPLTNVQLDNSIMVSLAVNMDPTILENVTLVGTDVNGYYIDKVVQKMKAGEIKYSGGSKTPDFELIKATNPQFSYYSTTITTNSESYDKLLELGFDPFVDYSSTEDHPLGRLEWCKTLGALFGKEDAAETFFKSQENKIENLMMTSLEDKTVAWFYIYPDDGTARVRNTDDYMAKMVEIAGGTYCIQDLPKNGQTTLEMEEFYQSCKDADYIIYIYSMGGKPETIDDLVGINNMLSDFKAVKEGHVWRTTKDFYQISNLGDMIVDINTLLNNDDNKLDELDNFVRMK